MQLAIAIMSPRSIACLAAMLLGCHSVAVHVKVVEKKTLVPEPAFMLVAGISAPEEMCLLQSGGMVSLDSCLAAVSAGDGRDVWSLQADGQLINLASSMCASSTADGFIVMKKCDGASSWKMLPNGQVQVGAQCLSQIGAGVGMENVAIRAAAAADSWADSALHGASAAVDADGATYWASKPDKGGPVVFSLDLGETRSISQIKINWAFPAQSFVVSSSVDGKSWEEVFSTDINMVNVTNILLENKPVGKMQIVMRKPHPLYGNFLGRQVYGIKSLSVLAPRLRVALDDCKAALKTKDARDKYFASFVSAVDATPAAALSAELPAFAAAKASLSQALSDLAAARLFQKGCTRTAALMSAKDMQPVIGKGVGGVFANLERARHSMAKDASKADGDQSIDAAIDKLHDVDSAGVKLLLNAAKSMIVSAREALT